MEIDFDFRWGRWVIGYWRINSMFTNDHEFYFFCFAFRIKRAPQNSNDF